MGHKKWILEASLTQRKHLKNSKGKKKGKRATFSMLLSVASPSTWSWPLAGAAPEPGWPPLPAEAWPPAPPAGPPPPPFSRWCAYVESAYAWKQQRTKALAAVSRLQMNTWHSSTCSGRCGSLVAFVISVKAAPFTRRGVVWTGHRFCNVDREINQRHRHFLGRTSLTAFRRMNRGCAGQPKW